MLSDLEEEIRRWFTESNESIFAGVITGGGVREFVFYTSNEAAAVAKAEALAREIRHHQLRFSVSDDPEWKSYKAFGGS